jgi:hypothetical protein
MSTYKVLQDIEAEDKLVGPLTLRQFIYAAVSAFLLYISFFAYTKNAGFLMVFFVPPALLIGFLAIPWHGDQPTEIWALAKLRFLLKPRKRIWDQSGAKNLVTITVPKKVERMLTNGLSQTEVRSRLSALADTIDSRGWAVKNMNVTVAAVPAAYSSSDRLVDASTLPQEVSGFDVQASDDILDASANPIAQHFDTMITDAAAAHRQQIVQQMQNQTVPAAAPTMPIPAPTGAAAAQPNDYWFMHQAAPVAGQATFSSAAVVAPGTTAAAEPPSVPQAAAPTDAEEALLEKLKAENHNQTIANDHLKHIKTPAELLAEQQAAAQKQAAETAAQQVAERQKAQVTSEKQAAIMDLARNDDQNIATLARRARTETKNDNGEVVISLR